MKNLKFIGFLLLICSIGQTAYTMDGDTLKPLEPKGIYLTESGFRRVLLQRNDLLECKELISLKDSTIILLRAESGIRMKENHLLQQAIKEQKNATADLKKKFWWSNLERWGWRSLAVYLLVRSL